MRIMKTLMLAGFGALSLGVGLANAQSLVPSPAEGSYYSGQRPAMPVPANRGAAVTPDQTVQFGGSDQVGPSTVFGGPGGVAGGF